MYPIPRTRPDSPTPLLPFPRELLCRPGGFRAWKVIRSVQRLPESGVAMKKTWFLPEQWDKFYAVLCSGASFSEAARVAGVSRNGAAYQWRKTGGMTLT